MVNKRPAKFPIKIILLNGKTIKSTHTCNIDIPWLPSIVTKAHIVPGLTHAYLISTRKFYNAGFQVAFDMDEFRVYYKNKLFLTGGCDPVTELWRLPTNPTAVRPAQSTVDRLGLKLMPHQTVLHVANNVHMIL